MALAVLWLPISGLAAINLRTDRSFSLPSIEVRSTPQSVYSGDLTLDLINNNDSAGWILTGEVDTGHLIGSSSGERIPATLAFKSITWVKGGNGNAAGITISPNGSTIEADPGFGLGQYTIVFEIRYDVPAYPRADSYQGVSTFIIQ
ncbi:hypothetical protein [Pelagicoccus sp. SDUM812003]|uniref:hypothetical protein n=1 Tax=Pelagicoccus sp. SDUM812003 TaxID=3041267 RepID=UPI00280C6579|nr:hypothetical protein [Pelagicoccus sp. SDUM812003]MDQ8202043.1 hypothetical protein [Pelagicoccus sp. SDUM812003]